MEIVVHSGLMARNFHLDLGGINEVIFSREEALGSRMQTLNIAIFQKCG